MSGFEVVNDDILQKILFKLQSPSFASAACVNKSWNKICDRAFCIPKLNSALSLNPHLPDAVNEVLKKVLLSEPIRPQFAIASVGSHFSLEKAQELLTQKLGSKIPLIINVASGIIGRDAIDNTLKEVHWQLYTVKDGSVSRGGGECNRGIVLIVGYLPGLKVEAIPLMRPKMGHRVGLVDRFLMNIKDYATHVSGSNVPTGIIMFGDHHIDLHPVLAEIDHAMPEETVIVGDATSRFIYRSGHDYTEGNKDAYFFDAVALVFARDRNKPPSIGEVRFHSTVSTGVVPFGPELRTTSVSINGKEHSRIATCINGTSQLLDCRRLLNDVIEKMEGEGVDFYIGVIQKRRSCTEQGRRELRSYLAFYEILGVHQEHLCLEGVGILPGDTFSFYRSDSDTEASSGGKAFQRLKLLKSSTASSSSASSSSNPYYTMQDTGDDGGKGEVFGSLLFSSHYREESYFDIYPVRNNFPNAPLAGFLCGREIGRDPGMCSVRQEDKNESPARCTHHAGSAVYLVLSYVPPPPSSYMN